jgi:DNA primase
MAILQHPSFVGRPLVERVVAAKFVNPTLAVVRDAVSTSLGALESPDWVSSVTAQAPVGYASLVQQLAVGPIPSRPDKLDTYCSQVATDLVDRDLARQHAEILGAMQRVDADDSPEKRRILQQQLAKIVDDRRALRET